jgi:hypothetical protein
MFTEMIQNEEAFVKKVVTERYMSKYEQFKKRIAKYQDKLDSKLIVGDSKPELVIDSISEPFENTKLYREPKRRTLAVVPPIPNSPMCYCRREVKNIENSVICANGLDNCP